MSPDDDVVVLAQGEERVVGEGELGELCFRGPSTLRSYVGDSDATRSAFTSDRFFRTGDLVRAHHIDGAPHFSFEGRLKDNIDRGGEKFGTSEIEVLLAGHPSIREACVVGMPDRYLGERVCAFVLLRSECFAPAVEDVGDYLLERGIAKFKLPERIEIIDRMPVTRVGKLDRVALRRAIAVLLEEEQGAETATGGGDGCLPQMRCG